MMDENEEKDNSDNSQDGSVEEDVLSDNATKKIVSDKVPENNFESDSNSLEENSNQSEESIKETANGDIIDNDKELKPEDTCNDSDRNSKGAKIKTKTPEKINQKKSGNEKAPDNKSDCQHLSKNFEIVKKKYHCPDCNAIVCPECLTVVPSTLIRHLQNADGKDYKIYPCKLCDLFFLSKCALQAHDRIHMLDTPHVCPDCGSIFKTIYYLTLHLINKCYHVYKSMRFRCSVCLSAYKTAEVFCDHIRNVHIKLMVKCSECDSLFSDARQVQRHAAKLHKDKQVKTKLFIRCSLCVSSAMPKDQESEHVKYHRDHSVTHQFIYLCPCGQPYNSVNGFKLHSDKCKKKGILPPQWNYLQTKMKAQELRLKDDATRPESPESNVCLKCGDELSDSGICRKCITDKDNSPLSPNETEPNQKSKPEKESLEVSQDKDVVVISLKDNNRNEINKNKSDEEKLKKQSRYFYYNFKKALQSQDTSMDADDDVIIIEDKTKNKDETFKIKYGHVPNDHLGYLKAYELNNLKEKVYDKELASPIEHVDKSSGYYRTEMILDEETGLMKPSQVWVEKKDSYKRLPIQTKDLQYPIMDTASAEFRKKYKDAFFTCPFCSTLFFKHESSFQKFLLHIECYHPDSGIDITVDKSELRKPELPKPKKPFYALRAQFDSEPDDDSEGDDVDLQTRINKNSKYEKPLRFKPMVVYEDDIGKITNSLKKPIDIENLQLKSNEKKDEGLDSKRKKKITYVKITTPSIKKKKEFFDKSDGNNGEDVVIMKNKISGKGNEAPNVEINPVKMVNGLRKIRSSERISDGPKLDDTNPVIDKSKDYLEHNKSLNEDSNLSSKKESDSEEVKLNESNESPHHKEEMSCDSASNHSFRSLRKKTKEDDTMPRKEREVWEEFYESLKIAERKVKKINEQEQSDNSEKPLIADYSTKRVVKKPKRYMESSGSESEEEESPGDDKSTPLDTNENSRDDEIVEIQKDQALSLTQHRNIDQKFVDYLFNFIEKKDTKTDLFKKHSTIRMNRGNVRDYRKDVLNGIRNRGRPRKYFNFKNSVPIKNQTSQESLLKSPKNEGGKDKPKTPEPEERASPEPLKTTPVKETPKTTPTKTPEKTEVKKRGRPRKSAEKPGTSKPTPVKERRLSDYDKEVNFIEKNFETNDNDSGSNKRKRKLSSKLVYYKKISKSEKDDFSSGQVITNKPEQTDKKLTCAICKEKHSSVTQFREHIISHRMDENTHQCMECGECFVVRPSLAKHLHAFHKIKDIDKYIAENDCGAKGQEPKVVEEEPIVEEDLKENQCKVCKDQFDCAGDLNKHFRIHGMAFLKEFKKDSKANC